MQIPKNVKSDIKAILPREMEPLKRIGQALIAIAIVSLCLRPSSLQQISKHWQALKFGLVAFPTLVGLPLILTSSPSAKSKMVKLYSILKNEKTAREFCKRLKNAEIHKISIQKGKLHLKIQTEEDPDNKIQIFLSKITKKEAFSYELEVNSVSTNDD